jgi:hypothetical protein
MEWLTTLRRSGGINALSRHLGVSPAEVSAATIALLPVILAGLRELIDRLGGDDAGPAALIDTLAELGGADLAAAVMGPEPLDVGLGRRIVEVVIGPDVARRAVLIEAERTAGLDKALAERVLPALAMLIGGYISALAVGSGAEGSGGLGHLRETLTFETGAADEDRI